MDILRIKKAHLPPPSAAVTRKKKERKVTSAAAVIEPDSRDSNDTTIEAGSSSGPGTSIALATQVRAGVFDEEQTDSDS